MTDFGSPNVSASVKKECVLVVFREKWTKMMIGRCFCRLSKSIWKHLLYIAVLGNDVFGSSAYLEGAMGAILERKCIRDVLILVLLLEYARL